MPGFGSSITPAPQGSVERVKALLANTIQIKSIHSPRVPKAFGRGKYFDFQVEGIGFLSLSSAVFIFTSNFVYF
jgi:hypothetical protein